MSSGDLSRPAIVASKAIAPSVAAMLQPLQALLACPALLFVITLAVLMFRPQDVNLYHADRIAVGSLTAIVLMRAVVQRQGLPIVKPIAIPMAILVSLAAFRAAAKPYDPQTWSLFAAEMLVPFLLFHMAMLVFDNDSAVRKFEMFVVVALAYMAFTSIAFLIGATGLIFPRFILDETLGIHVDRARGPFLQAVANGVSLTILGLLAVDCYRRGRLHRIAAALLLLSLPFAIMATMTRAVWIGFVASAAAMCWVVKHRSARRMVAASILLCVAGVTLALCVEQWRSTLLDRASESGPVEIRSAIYSASWEMICERPLLGWGPNQMPAEVAQRMPDYDLDVYWAHNTYLELVVEHGIVGLTLYICVVIGLFRLVPPRNSESAKSPFGSVWPIALSVYLFNALFVVMNYQFVNALVFTMAGILAAQNRRTCTGELLND